LCPAKTRDFDEIVVVVVVVVVVVFVLFVDISARIARSLERVWFSCNAPWRLVFDRGRGEGEGGGGRRGRLFDENKAVDDDDDDEDDDDDDDGCRLGGSRLSLLPLSRAGPEEDDEGGPHIRYGCFFSSRERVLCVFFNAIFRVCFSLLPSDVADDPLLHSST
jgi:hypothetical protein